MGLGNNPGGSLGKWASGLGGGSYTDAEAIAAVEGESTLTLAGDLVLADGAEIRMQEEIVWTAAGPAVSSTAFSIGRDSTNDLQFNVPSGESFNFSVAGVDEMTISAAALTMDGRIRTGDGDFSSPGFGFNSEPDTGLYIGGANILGVAAGGVSAFTVAAASGIIFPATQSASANANGLDDYEEGDWTISITFDGASSGLVSSVNTGAYTKIGRQVSVTGNIVLTSKGTSTGTALITGLPFTNGAGTKNRSSGTIDAAQVSFANQMTFLLTQGATTINLVEMTEAGVRTVLNNLNFSSNSNLSFSCLYFTD